MRRRPARVQHRGGTRAVRGCGITIRWSGSRESGPALLVYGDRDSTVSYDSAAQTRGGCEFHTVAGSDHGFGSREREDEDEAIAVTVSLLSRQYGS